MRENPHGNGDAFRAGATKVMRISDFIERSNAAKSPEDIFDLFGQAVSQFGYNRVAFGAVTPAAQEMLALGNLKPAIALNYPEDWVKRYFEMRYQEIDPVVLLSSSRSAPMVWSSLLIGDDLSPKQKKIFTESREAGLNNGVSIPVHGPLGESYVVSLATDTAEHHNGEALGTLQVLAIQFQLAYSQIARGQPETQAKFHLTERERECLAWTARGKSAWAISMILGVSEHTVNFHMKSAMKKMGTTNRVSAVVSAIQSGLIVP